MKIKGFILFTVALLFSQIRVFAQCSVCTSCTTSATGCTYAVSSSDNTNRTLGSGQKLCINSGGIYTGSVTLNGGTVVVSSGGIFNPGGITIGVTSGGTIEIKSGASATISGINVSLISGSFTLNNCGNLTMNGTVNSSASGSGSVNINNAGTYTSAGNINLASRSTVCNSGGMTLKDVNASTSSTNALINSGTFVASGTLQQSSNSPIYVCPNSFMQVGNLNSAGNIIGGGTCGAMKVIGNSNCGGCNISGSVDVCDSSGSAMTNSPRLDNFSGGTIGGSVTYCNCVVTLPVELLSFNAAYNKKAVNIDWVTASEINNDFFTVEKSPDGKTFTAVTTIKGAGNSNTVLKYHTVDDNPLPGISYYRLKQTDYNGQYEYSRLAAVKAGYSDNTGITYFYSSENALQYIINTSYLPDKDFLVEITDMLGKSVLHVKSRDKSGVLDVSSLSKGIYFLRVSDGEQAANTKIIR